MNKDKAIQLLERLQEPEPYEPMLTKDAYDAIQMAIDALSADGDTISREAAIEVIDSFNVFESRSDQIKLEQMIGELPPAQPEPSQLGTNLAEVSTRAVRGYPIDADALMEKVAEEYGDRARNWLYQIIRYMPPAQPEIIRCKDCKYRMPYDWMFSETWQSQNMDDYPDDEIGCLYCDMAMKANDFCSRAERRDVTT